jgi:hypothetical protein
MSTAENTIEVRAMRLTTSHLLVSVSNRDLNHGVTLSRSPTGETEIISHENQHFSHAPRADARGSWFFSTGSLEKNGNGEYSDPSG